MAGYDPRDPLSLDAAGARQHRSASRDGMRGVRIAWLGDLGGYLATEPEVLEVTRSALRALEDAGAEVIELMLTARLPLLLIVTVVIFDWLRNVVPKSIVLVGWV